MDRGSVCVSYNFNLATECSHILATKCKGSDYRLLLSTHEGVSPSLLFHSSHRCTQHKSHLSAPQPLHLITTWVATALRDFVHCRLANTDLRNRHHCTKHLTHGLKTPHLRCICKPNPTLMRTVCLQQMHYSYCTALHTRMPPTSYMLYPSYRLYCNPSVGLFILHKLLTTDLAYP
jgi:hypothetical protein